MFDKLLKAQEIAGDIKKRLDAMEVTGEAENGRIRVVATASKKALSVKIDPAFLTSADAEELEELLTIAVNRAMEKADQVSGAETQAATRDMFGGLF